jgi:hypothetical protein
MREMARTAGDAERGRRYRWSREWAVWLGICKPKGRRVMSDEIGSMRATVRMLRALVDQAKGRRIAAGEEGTTDEEVVGDVVTVTSTASIASGIDEGVGYEEELAALMGELLQEGALEPAEGSDRAVSYAMEGAEAYVIQPGAIEALGGGGSP